MRRLHELRRRLPSAISRKFDTTIFNGTAPGSGFDVLTNVTAEDIETKPYDGLVKAYGAIANAGKRPSAFVLSPAAEVVLYGAVDGNERPLFLPSVSDGGVGALLGAPVVRSKNVYFEGNPNVLGFVGDWSQAKWGMVGDISIAISEEATINTGTELVNLWQRNMFGVRVEATIGFVCADENAFVKLTGATGA